MTPEFVESYYLGRVTLFRRVNRVVSGLFLVVSTLALPLEPTFPGASEQLYQLYSVWLFVVVLASLGLSLRDLVRRQTRFGPLVTTALVLAAASAVTDVLVDLDLVFFPRLFTFGVTNLAIASAMVLVGEFLQLAQALLKAQESSPAKSEFLANTSHELRTPLNSIINIPQGLLEHLRRAGRCVGEVPGCGAAALVLQPPTWKLELEPEETARLLGSVVANGKHLLAVVNDLLDYSKIEAGRLTLHREPTRLSELLDEVRVALDPLAERAGVRLLISPPPPLSLDLDRVRMTQVLLNLVGNALKFADGHGTVTVTTVVRGTTLELSVHDEGIGIASEHQAMIFEGFRQVEGGNTRRFGGTGVGLSISRKLVEAHQGTLRVESTLGKGSTFVVALPL